MYGVFLVHIPVANFGWVDFAALLLKKNLTSEFITQEITATVFKKKII